MTEYDRDTARRLGSSKEEAADDDIYQEATWEPSIIVVMKLEKIKPNGGSSEAFALRADIRAGDQKTMKRYMVPSKMVVIAPRPRIRLSIWLSVCRWKKREKRIHCLTFKHR